MLLTTDHQGIYYIWSKPNIARASLTIKDLRPEDKQKIANLIKELEKAKQEKDETKREFDNYKASVELELEDLRDQNQHLIESSSSNSLSVFLQLICHRFAEKV